MLYENGCRQVLNVDAPALYLYTILCAQNYSRLLSGRVWGETNPPSSWALVVLVSSRCHSSPGLSNADVNSLVRGRFQFNFRYVIFKQILVIGGWGISCEIALIWMSLEFNDDQSTLVQVVAWCRQAASQYLSQCWPRSLSPYGVTRPQWVMAVLDFLGQNAWWSYSDTRNSGLRYQYATVSVNWTLNAHIVNH